MDRNLIWIAAALTASAYITAGGKLSMAQESTEASAEASTSNQAETDASADASASNGQTNDTSTESTDQSSTSSDANADSSSAEATADQDAATSSETSTEERDESRSIPAPSTRTDVNADRSGEQSLLDENQRPDQRSATDQRTPADAERSQRTRTHVDARAEGDARVDMRRGIRFGRATERGLTIDNIERNSVYFDSGFRRGDVVVSFDGRPVRSEDDFQRFIVRHRSGRVPVVVWRHGRQETIYVVYPQQELYSQRVYDTRRTGGQAYLGVTFDAQVRDAAVVARVTAGSPAEEAGLQPGDMIVAMNGDQIMSYRDAISMIRTLRPGDRLDIVLERGRSELETEAVLAGQPAGNVRTATREGEVYVEGQLEAGPRDDGRPYVERRNRVDDRRILDGERDRPLRRRLFN
jgi:C-terminal processing protease CtpA/Prc